VYLRLAYSDGSRVWNTVWRGPAVAFYNPLEPPSHTCRNTYRSTTWPYTYSRPNVHLNAPTQPDTYSNAYTDEGGDNGATHRP